VGREVITIDKGLVAPQVYHFQEEKQPGAVFHSYNLSYSGGTDEEDQGSSLVWAKSSRDSISTNTKPVIPAVWEAHKSVKNEGGKEKRRERKAP
jgi:hypothetical protein